MFSRALMRRVRVGGIACPPITHGQSRNFCLKSAQLAWVRPQRVSFCASSVAAAARQFSARSSYSAGTSASKVGGFAWPSGVSTGQAFVGVSAIGGIGALCFYGAGLSNEAGAIDTAQFWPGFVRERVRYTFATFGAGLAMTAAQAAVLFRTGVAQRLMTGSPMLAFAGTIAAMFGSQMLVHAVPFENKMAKFAAYAVFTGVTAAVICPVVALGGQIVIRAAAYTAVTVGGLCAVAACAPSEKFLYMGGPLACGLGVVFCASLGGAFFPGAAVAPLLHSISMYGGLVLFSGFVLYDTQKILAKAQVRGMHYDPVNESIGIYMDTINIFVRIAYMLAGGGGRKK